MKMYSRKMSTLILSLDIWELAILLILPEYTNGNIILWTIRIVIQKEIHKRVKRLRHNEIYLMKSWLTTTNTQDKKDEEFFNDGAHSLVQREYVIVPIVSTSKLRRGVPFGGGEADIEDFGHGDPLVNNKHVYYE